MKLLHWLDDNFEETVMAILLAVISCVIMLQVIMRYCFSHAMPWPEELCRILFVYSGLLSAGYCIKKNKNLHVDVLTGFLPKPVQNFIDIVGKALVLVVYLFLGYKSFALIASTSTTTTAMQLSYKVVYAALPIGFFLGAVRQIQQFVMMYLNHKHKKEEVA